MQNGDTHFERNRFSTFAGAFGSMAIDLQRAVNTASQHPLSLVLIELTSSALDEARSPIMNSFAKRVLSKSVRQGASPDGGIIVSVPFATAFELSSELNSIRSRLEAEVKVMTRLGPSNSNRSFDTKAREELIRAIQTGEGIVPRITLSGEEVLVCSEFFNR